MGKAKECAACGAQLLPKATECVVCGHAVPKKEKAKQPRVEKTEAEIVRQYAKVIMDKQTTRDMLPPGFEDLQSKKPNKSLWQDDDFYLAIVFESYDQKMDFVLHLIEKFKIPDDAYTQYGSIKILNGLKLASLMGLELKREIANDYPLANMELRNLILDYERKE